MSVIAHNGKVVVSGGKTLNFDNLIALANNTTGETDTTLTDAVQSLIDGFGGGGGVMPAPAGYELVTNEFDFTPAVDSNPDIVLNHGLGVVPAYIICSLNDVNAILNNGKATFAAGYYFGGGEFSSYMDGLCISGANLGLFNKPGSYGGHYKRENERLLRAEATNVTSYYIRNVNDTSFNLGYDGAFTWVAGAEIHVACFGFKEVVA